MYPEVEQFIAAMEAAEKDESEAWSMAHSAYMDKRREAGLGRATHVYGAACLLCEFDEGPARAEMTDAIQAGVEAMRTAQTAAWDALKASTDPLIRWIAANCRDYEDEAQEILRRLPASVEELDSFAKANEWCGVYSGFREDAERAGVLPAPAAAPAESGVTA